jgi:hypothetical protein
VWPCNRPTKLSEQRDGRLLDELVLSVGVGHSLLINHRKI